MKFEKLATFWNFSKRNGSAVIGTDNILKKKSIKLVLLSDDIADNSKKRIKEFCDMRMIKYVEIINENFQLIVRNQNIKAIGLCDQNLVNGFEEYMK